MRFLTLLFGTIAITVAVMAEAAQTTVAKPVFEVVSIKPGNPEAGVKRI